MKKNIWSESTRKSEFDGNDQITQRLGLNRRHPRAAPWRRFDGSQAISRTHLHLNPPRFIYKHYKINLLNIGT